MKINNLARVICLLSICCFVLISGCSSEPAPSQKTEPTQTTQPNDTTNSEKNQKVTIAQYGHIFVYLPLYVAQQKGFFKEEGFDITFVSTGGDEKTFAALVSGSAQFGVSDPIFTAIAKERGQGGKVVASIVNGVPLWGVTKKDIPFIADPTMFSGIRVATYPAPSTTYTLVKDAVAMGAKTKTPAGTIVQGAFGTLLAMLENDAADMAVVIEPDVSIAISQGMKVVYSLPEVHGDFAFTGLMVTDEYLKNNKETIQRMVNALVKATNYIRNNLDGAAAVAHAEFPELSLEVCKNGVNRMVEANTVPASMQMSDKAWQQAIILRVQAGDLKAATPMADNVDNSFVVTAEKAIRAK